jgi:hypothetical protein
MSLTPRALSSIDHLEPEPGAFALFDPQPEHVLLAVRIERQRHIDGFLDQAPVANLDDQRVEKNHWIDQVERSVLPFPYLVEDHVGDPANEVGRNVRPIQFGQVTLDLAPRHTTGVKAHNLVVKAVKAPLPFGDQLRLEASGAIARDRNLDLAILGQRQK